MDKQSYCTYPRLFRSYRWYKPLLTGLLAAVFTLAALIAVAVAMELLGYDMPAMDSCDVIHTATDPTDVLWTVPAEGGYLALLWFGKKRGWYDRVRRDDPAAYNAWYEQRLARKAAKKHGDPLDP